MCPPEMGSSCTFEASRAAHVRAVCVVLAFDRKVLGGGSGNDVLVLGACRSGVYKVSWSAKAWALGYAFGCRVSTDFRAYLG